LHNTINALAAAAATLFVGFRPKEVACALASFTPLEHRIEPVATYNGISFVNDSKATNTDATVQALTAFEPGRVILLLGGHDKMTPLETFCPYVGKHARTVICYGEAGPRFAQAFTTAVKMNTMEPIEVLTAAHLGDAFSQALRHARIGDTILLSPACSSYDEFHNFEERGAAFKTMVKAYGGEHGASARANAGRRKAEAEAKAILVDDHILLGVIQRGTRVKKPAQPEDLIGMPQEDGAGQKGGAGSTLVQKDGAGAAGTR
jgi:UDP-N-acetylmuramoylalanine--D-glutamate ligase